MKQVERETYLRFCPLLFSERRFSHPPRMRKFAAWEHMVRLEREFHSVGEEPDRAIRDIIEILTIPGISILTSLTTITATNRPRRRRLPYR
jgi:hypothetical protein